MPLIDEPASDNDASPPETADTDTIVADQQAGAAPAVQQSQIGRKKGKKRLKSEPTAVPLSPTVAAATPGNAAKPKKKAKRAKSVL